MALLIGYTAVTMLLGPTTFPAFVSDPAIAWLCLWAVLSVAVLAGANYRSDGLLPTPFYILAVALAWAGALALAAWAAADPWELQRDHTWLGPTQLVWAPRHVYWWVARAVLFLGTWGIVARLRAPRPGSLWLPLLPVVIAVIVIVALASATPPIFAG